MKRKELTKTFHDDFKLKKPFGLHVFFKYSALQGLKYYLNDHPVSKETLSYNVTEPTLQECKKSH